MKESAKGRFFENAGKGPKKFKIVWTLYPIFLECSKCKCIKKKLWSSYLGVPGIDDQSFLPQKNWLLDAEKVFWQFDDKFK